MPSMRAFYLSLFTLTLVSCGPDETITRVREPKAGAAPAFSPPSAPASRRLRWSLPKGWRELPGSGMRAATLLPPGGGKLEGTVIALPGDVGGELANVNRWRGQLGLPSIDEAGLAGARSVVGSRAGKVSVYDMEGGGQRTVAGALSAGGMTWFLKLSGESAAVAEAKPSFLRLLGSLHAAP